MPQPNGPTPAQIQLARDVFAAGLAPKGVTQLDCMDGPAWYYDAGGQWRPWRSWDAVAHLIKRWGMTIYGFDEPPERPMIVGDGDHERADSFADIPAAVCRLALRLAAAEKAHESVATE